jgi:tetratricopeptide (TPR) repeat protein
MRKLLFFALVAVLAACNGKEKERAVETATGYPEIDAATAAIQANPKDPALYLRRAKAYNAHEGYDQAIRDLQKAIGLDSTFVEAYHLLADTYLDYYNSRMALNTLYDAVRRFPNRVPTLLKLTEFQFILQMYEAAGQTIDRILALDPVNADAWFWKGMIARDAEKSDEAIRYFQKATELDPFLTDAWVECGKLLAKSGKPIAERYFRNAVELDSLDASAWHAYAEYFQDRARYSDALETYRRLVRIDPNYTDAFYNSGLIYLEMDSLAQAREHFTLAIKVEPTMAMAYLARGNTFELAGRKEEARKDYEQALVLDPSLDRAQAALDKLQ